jgi:hypothetical protein
MIKRAVIQKQDTKSTEAADIDLGEVAQPYPLIPPGEYDVTFVKAHKMGILRSQRLITYWRIIDLGSPYHDVVLIMGFPYPKKSRKKWGVLSKMAVCYRIATGRDPDRFDTGRLSTRVFKDKVFLAKVVTVTRSLNQDQRTEESHYSVIERLIA